MREKLLFSLPTLDLLICAAAVDERHATHVDAVQPALLLDAEGHAPTWFVVVPPHPAGCLLAAREPSVEWEWEKVLCGIVPYETSDTSTALTTSKATVPASQLPQHLRVRGYRS